MHPCGNKWQLEYVKNKKLTLPAHVFSHTLEGGDQNTNVGFSKVPEYTEFFVCKDRHNLGPWKCVG